MGWYVLDTNRLYSIQTVVFNQHRCESIPILTYTFQYNPILTNTLWLDWYVLNTNRSSSINPVCIQTASLWIHTYSNLYRPVQTNTNQYIVNGLVCIQSVFRKPIQIQYLYWLKQASIQTCINQYSSIHTNTSWIDWYVLNTNSSYCIRIGLPIWTNPGDTGQGTYSSKGTCRHRARRCVMHWQELTLVSAQSTRASCTRETQWRPNRLS